MRYIVLFSCLMSAGCVSTPKRPHWEVSLSFHLESHLDKNNKSDATLTFKRPIPAH